MDLVLEDTDSPSNLAATGQNDVLVRLRPVLDGHNPTETSRCGYGRPRTICASTRKNAVACALDLRRLRPQGTVQ